MVKNLKRVLIVDDEETLTWSMARSLSKDKDKYEVIIANNGREALDHLENKKIGTPYDWPFLVQSVGDNPLSHQHCIRKTQPLL